jgi:nitric oxide reductase NorD protein
MDYGSDRRSITYGIRDTMMALREADRAGVLTFCLTVDKAGHDYLREMCEPSRYLVLEDVASLPTELPKVYQRYIRPRGTS